MVFFGRGLWGRLDGFARLVSGVEIDHLEVVVQCFHDGLPRDARRDGGYGCEDCAAHSCDRSVVSRMDVSSDLSALNAKSRALGSFLLAGLLSQCFSSPRRRDKDSELMERERGSMLDDGDGDSSPKIQRANRIWEGRDTKGYADVRAASCQAVCCVDAGHRSRSGLAGPKCWAWVLIKKAHEASSSSDFPQENIYF